MRISRGALAAPSFAIAFSGSLLAADAYFREVPGRLILGNDLVEIGLSSDSGAILSLLRKGGREWLGGTADEVFAFSLDPTAPTVWLAGEGQVVRGASRLSDPLSELSYLFLGGPPPDAPFGACGAGSGPGGLGCGSFPPCGG